MKQLKTNIMKVFTFTNGKVVLQKNTNTDFRTQCIMWGCFEPETGKPLAYTEREATLKEIRDEEIRMEEIQNEFLEVCEYNNRVNRGNEKLANATNIKQFINAYL